MMNQKIKLFISIGILLFCMITGVKAKEIFVEHSGRIVINTINMKNNEKLNDVQVIIYKIASYDENYNYEVVDELKNYSLDDPMFILKKLKDSNLLYEEKNSSNGSVVFDDLEVGKYLVYIPYQSINSIKYAEQAYYLDVPSLMNNNYSYLIESTPKLLAEHTTSKQKIISTSFAEKGVLYIFLVGVLLTIIGGFIYHYGKIR